MSAEPDADLVEARRWLRQAEAHLAAGQCNSQGSHWAEACFWCQQAAELALKALLIHQGERARVHQLLYLVERLTPHLPGTARLSDAARRLERFYMPTRYPDALPRGTAADFFVEQDYKDAQADATEVLNFARQKLLQP